MSASCAEQSSTPKRKDAAYSLLRRTFSDAICMAMAAAQELVKWYFQQRRLCWKSIMLSERLQTTLLCKPCKVRKGKGRT